MPTVIDALVVTLGLDPADFEKGRKDTEQGLAKTRDAVDKTGASLDKMGKGGAEALEGLARRALAFFAILAGAKSVEEFTKKIIGSDAALGRLAVTLGVLPEDLYAMAGAVERNGGSAEAAAESFRSLNDSFEEIKWKGTTGIWNDLSQLNGLAMSLDKNFKGIETHKGLKAALPGLVNALEIIKTHKGVVDADWWARRIHIDPETAIALEQGWAKFSADVDRYKKENPPDLAWTKTAQQLVEGWSDAEKAIQGFGRYFVETFSPLMQHEMKLLVDILHGDLIKMLGDWTNIIGDIGNLTNDFYHKLTGKWIFDPNEGNGAPDSDGGPRLPGAGGTGLRSRRNEAGGNEAIARRGHVSANTSELVRHAKAQLIAEGVPQENASAAAAALVGNVIQESRGDPNKVHDGGTGYGLYGARAIRRTRMLNWLAANGYPANSAEGQMKYMAHEAMSDPTYRRTADALRSATTSNLGDVTNVVATDFERPVPASANYIGRRNNAAAALARVPVYTPPGPNPAYSIPNAMSVYGDISGAMSAFRNSSSTTNHTTSTDVSVGEVHIHTQAKDSEGIAKTIKPAIERHSFATHANYGPA